MMHACNAARAASGKPATLAAPVAWATYTTRCRTPRRCQTTVDEAAAPEKPRVLPKNLQSIQSFNALEVLADGARRCDGEHQRDPALEHGLRELSILLKDNSYMGSDLLQCFASFPEPPTDIQRAHRTLTRWTPCLAQSTPETSQTHARPNAHISELSTNQQASGAHWSSGSPVSAQSPVVQASTAMRTIHKRQAVQPQQAFVAQPTPTEPTSTGLLIPGRTNQIPINESPSDPQDSNCIMRTLHHAHIRSPKRLRIRPEAQNERYYQSVRRLVLGPTSIAPSAVVHKFSFHLGPRDRDRLTHVETDPDDRLPIQEYTNGTVRVRIHYCYLLDQRHSITDSDWVTKDVIWPEHLFLEVNYSGLTLRRKAHHSKDLPVEVPANALSEENHLHVWVPETAKRPRQAPKNSHPYLAVELVETLSHSAILSLVKAHGIQQSSKTLKVIRRRLSSTTASNDDEIAVVSHELVIDLADPFTSAIFKTPWKCPLCSGDARPYSLRIDEWLAEVRDKLEKDGTLRAKAILVSADGSWKINEVVEEYLPPGAAPEFGNNKSVAAVVKETPVIAIDSD
ncbi:uncharacterized protein B0I36DRAFT_437103 [Microdochium trichocladiopsis]|uniref:SP-RING-type domain-containing protein n=1 Tax=Microdochium trichocladiopsis TaxID=1682393 RepID=A0A9P8XQR2_9PEZI|nr:uncharacterized protein B0I36DRAFT_437103 [Microdochium trichocladiopsis]KAH7009100.1 hypothetical protein B0I36DRAFT_437103 [Microdochium trichocladiopsis]